MRTTRRVQVTGALGLCLLGAPLLCLAWRQPPSPSGRASPLVNPTRYRSPSEKARQEGWRCWRRAQEAVNQEREQLEAWDPQASGTRGQEVWRQQLMARDRTGDLRRAQAAAQRAASLARTDGEACEAALLRARIECDLGDHEAEIEQAQQLVRWELHSPRALGALQRAAVCTGRAPLARALQAILEETGDTALPHP